MNIRTCAGLNALMIIGMLLIEGCAPRPYAATNKIYRKQSKLLAREIRRQPWADSLMPPPSWAGTIHFNLRKPNFVVIHHTAQNSCAQTLRTFTVPQSQVSAHYVICKDGTVHHMLNDYLRAWHAGVSWWGNNSDINSSSIGIEIDNNGREMYTEVQIESLLRLLEKLKRLYAIPDAHFIGHSDVAPGRKVDPGRTFPWQRLAEKSYGLWYDTIAVQVPEPFNALQAMRIVGYNTRDSLAAIHSFKLHFVQNDTTDVITEADKKILYDLMNRYQ